MRWTSLPLLKTTTTKGRARRGDAFKSKCAPLTLTDEEAALAAPESNQLLHRQLRKRYYVEALNFMRMVEGTKWVFFSSFLFSSLLSLSPGPSLLSFGKKIADAFPLLIILAYFYRCGG